MKKNVYLNKRKMKKDLFKSYFNSSDRRFGIIILKV